VSSFSPFCALWQAWKTKTADGLDPCFPSHGMGVPVISVEIFLPSDSAGKVSGLIVYRFYHYAGRLVFVRYALQGFLISADCVSRALMLAYLLNLGIRVRGALFSRLFSGRKESVQASHHFESLLLLGCFSILCSGRLFEFCPAAVFYFSAKCHFAKNL
jgi:hypothetical protein